MDRRWLPFILTTAALALAVVAPAQSRSRGGGGRSGGGSESRPSRPPEQRSSGSPRSGGDSRSGGESRSGGYRPSRSGEDRPSRSDRSPSRTSDDRSSRDRDRSSRSGGDNPIFPGRRDRDRNGSDRDVTIRGDNNRIILGDRTGAPVRYRPSRSGTVAYGSAHNGYGRIRATRYDGGYNRSLLGIQIRRNQPRIGFEANYTYGGVYGGLRYGYVGYNRGWRDDYFAYPYYIFDPFVNASCVASPWYRYSYLPPYLDNSRVIVVNNYSSSWNDNDNWRDSGSNDRDGRDQALSGALDDLRDAFERNSDRYGERLLPEDGQVAIFNDGKYDYSLGASDFSDMFLDGIEQSKTVSYEIVESRTKSNEVRLRARHEYRDSWDATQVVFHTYTLRREGGRYVIREFGTD